MTSPNDLILHQYEVSPYAEKVRLAFGLKGLAWSACNQPSIMPKPELLALTGPYRRIPVLQIGADIYCDSELILDELERRFPTPSLFAPCGRMTNRLYQQWADGQLFPTVVGLLFSGDWKVSEDFMADRTALSGRPFDQERFRAAVPELSQKFHALLGLLERQLADGRKFLCGDVASAPDLQVFHNLVFVRWGKGATTALLDQHVGLKAWEARMALLGHGARRDIDPQQAIAVARQAQHPAAAAGRTVRFLLNDANSPPVAGRLIGVEDGRVSILLETPEAGHVAIHLPESAGRLE